MTTEPARRTTSPRPVVERVAGWSVRHRKIVVIGWLLLVVAAFAIGQHLGTGNTNSYAPGQAGRAERQVVAALERLPGAAADIQSPFTSTGLAGGRSALVTFNVAGNPSNDDTIVVQDSGVRPGGRGRSHGPFQ